MKRVAGLLVLFLLLPRVMFAAAFQFYELGTPVIGTAAVGQAVVMDASSAYFNPAAMVAVKNTQYLVGSQAIIPYTQFKKDDDKNTISGGSGGEATTLTPGMGIYFVHSFHPKFRVGLSLTSPYGGLLDYTDGWVGRYIVQDSEFYTLNLNPSFAYQMNDKAAIGAGFSVEYANLSQTVAFKTGTVDPELGEIDGQADVKTDNTHVGFNVGLLLTPTPKTTLGLAYRSQIKHNLQGTTTFLRLRETPATSTQIIMPQNIILSAKQVINARFNLLAEGGWANWSSMTRNVVTVDTLSATTVLDWKDTYRVGLGGQYYVTPAFLAQLGVSYDSSPTEASLRTPNLPMDGQIRAGLGLIYTAYKVIQLGFSYEYINFGSAPIENVSRNGTFAGSYWKNFANVIQASINVGL